MIRLGRLLAAGLLLLPSACARGLDRYTFYPAAPADGQPVDRISNAEPDTDSGDMSIACRPADHGLVFTHYWAGRRAAGDVVLEQAGRRRRIPASYDPDGMGVVTFALSGSDPAIAALRGGRIVRVRYGDGRTMRLFRSEAMRKLVAHC